MPEVFFTGPEGRIEGRYIKSRDSSAPIALVLHPHPQYGGNMNNKVVYSLYKKFAENGFSVLRINFRGVGRSQGSFDNGIGELADAATAMDWLQLNNPSSNINWVAGFSFGSWIGMQLIMRRPEITNFVSISPPVSKYDFSFLSPCPIPGLVIQGNKDSVVKENDVAEFIDKINKSKVTKIDYNVIKNADHFFRNDLNNLEDILSKYLEERKNLGVATIKVRKKYKKVMLE